MQQDKGQMKQIKGCKDKQKVMHKIRQDKAAKTQGQKGRRWQGKGATVEPRAQKS